jgi:hypothetical protein
MQDCREIGLPFKAISEKNPGYLPVILCGLFTALLIIAQLALPEINT